MKNSTYRIITYCPNGISKGLKEYLAKEIHANSDINARDAIAIKMLEPYKDSIFPFCCTFICWAQKDYKQELENSIINVLNDISISKGTSPVASEGFGQEVENGYFQIIGAYPLLDLKEKILTEQYHKVSLVLNKEKISRILDWCYKTFLSRALQSDKVGIVCAVLSENEQLADKKIQEIYNLLITHTANLTEQDKCSWVARPSGNMTLEVFDALIQKQIIKIDMLKSNTLKAGTNGEILCKSLNNLNIVTLFPEIFSSLHDNDTVLSQMPLNSDWEASFKWLVNQKIRSQDYNNSSVDQKRFIDIMPYKESGYSQFPWKVSFLDDKRRLKLLDADNSIIADKDFSKTFQVNEIYRIRTMFEIGVNYLNCLLCP